MLDEYLASVNYRGMHLPMTDSLSLCSPRFLTRDRIAWLACYTSTRGSILGKNSELKLKLTGGDIINGGCRKVWLVGKRRVNLKHRGGEGFLRERRSETSLAVLFPRLFPYLFPRVPVPDTIYVSQG